MSHRCLVRKNRHAADLDTHIRGTCSESSGHNFLNVALPEGVGAARLACGLGRGMVQRNELGSADLARGGCR